MLIGSADPLRLTYRQEGLASTKGEAIDTDRGLRVALAGAGNGSSGDPSAVFKR